MILVLTGVLAVILVCVGACGAALRYALVYPLLHRPQNPSPTPARTKKLKARESRLRGHLDATASVPHNTQHYASLQHTADYIARSLDAIGLEPMRQTFTVDHGTVVQNIFATRPALKTSPTPATMVIGAHYDSAGDSPGANDNGSGVAALIEICRDLADHEPEDVSLHFVFFVNEESPYCKTADMGSLRYAERLKNAGARITGMMALETLGFFSSVRGSQHFPFPFNHIYDDRGDFIAFVGLPRARRFTKAATRAFRNTDTFPSIGGIAPGFIPGIDLSDHWSFNEFGFPALMITDTAPFRNPFYHQLNDVPANVDCKALSRITEGLTAMIRELAPQHQTAP